MLSMLLWGSPEPATPLATPTTTNAGKRTGRHTNLPTHSDLLSTVAPAIPPTRAERRDVTARLPGSFWPSAKSSYVVDFDWAVKKGVGLRGRARGLARFLLRGGLLNFAKLMYAFFLRKTPETTILDARAKEAEEGLSKAEFFDKYGFVLLDHASAMTAEDWLGSDRDINEALSAVGADDGGIRRAAVMRDFREGDTPARRIYREEVKGLLTNALFADEDAEVMPPARGIRRYITRNPNKMPAKQIHNDYGLDFDDVVDRNPFFDFEAQRGLYDSTNATEYMLVNLWRPIKPMSTPCRSLPLCFLDASTLEPDDFVSIDSKSLGVTTALKDSARHQFYYYPDMTGDEVVVFKQFHQVRGEPGARMPVFHTAFPDPSANDETEGRVSFEYRVGVLLHGAK